MGQAEGDQAAALGAQHLGDSLAVVQGEGLVLGEEGTKILWKRVKERRLLCRPVPGRQ